MKTLEINKECWIQYRKAIYLGTNEKNQHIAEYVDKDSRTTQYLDYEPLPIPSFAPPQIISKSNSILKYSGKMTAWLREKKLVFFYEYKSITNPNGKDYLTEKEISEYTVLNIEDFWDGDKVYEELEIVNAELRPIRKQISELQNQERELLKKKSPIYEKCLHEWEKLGDEQETGRNGLGMGYSQDYECSICGKEKTTYYTRL